MEDDAVRDRLMALIDFKEINNSVEKLISEGYLYERDRNIARFILYFVTGGIELAKKEVDYDEDWLENLSNNGFLDSRFSVPRIYILNTDDNEEAEIRRRVGVLYAIMAAKNIIKVENGKLQTTEQFENARKKKREEAQ